MEGTITTRKKGKLVDIDVKVKDMLKWDADGEELLFEISPERFLQLPPEVWKEFSLENRQRYHIASQAAKIEKDFSSDEWKDFEVKGDLGLATDRLRLSGADDAHFSYYLARPDKMKALAVKGWRPSETATFNGTNSRSLTNLGQTELVIMEMPKPMKAKRDVEKREITKKRKDALESGGRGTFPVVEREHGKMEIIKGR